MSSEYALLAPCGMYCGVCGIFIASAKNDMRLKEIMSQKFHCAVEEIVCDGCRSTTRFLYCRVCQVRACIERKQAEGCHYCHDFPCEYIDDLCDGSQDTENLIRRSLADWRKLGTAKWVKGEETRYRCPHCGQQLFRGFTRCYYCEQPVDILTIEQGPITKG